ncbi:MAG: hypothetical protein AB7O21_06100 [Gammaproteobacteria bacterium]
MQCRNVRGIGAALAVCGMLVMSRVQASPPQALLVLAKDEPWFHAAYADIGPATGNGPAPAYQDAVDYPGYFHPRQCYRYQDAAPEAAAIFAPVGLGAGPHEHYCTGVLDDAWSGNFLNWATMTRMDLLRQTLYGGTRAAIANGDTATSTILERAHLPADGHAFAQYYNGADIDALVPFAGLKVDAANGGDGDGVDDADEGITLCNVSYKSAGSSQGTTGPTPVEVPHPAPMLRVVRENFRLWDANERRQCTWDDEHGDNGNGNFSGQSGLFAGSSDPPAAKILATPAGTRDHVVRIAACVPAFFDPDTNVQRCTAYGTNLKPEGVLQAQGLNGALAFGLVTTSYARNQSGGVLRKRMGSLTDEVDPANGTFLPKTGGQPGIIRTLNALRVFGYAYNNGTYGADSTDRTAGGENCTFQVIGFPEGQCRSWGNPVSELYLEALRYFTLGTGRAPTPAFDANDSASMAGVVPDAWNADPLVGTDPRPSLNIVLLNAAPGTHDHDQTNGLSALIGDVTTLTDAVGAGEALHGASVQVGAIDAFGNEFCTPKNLTSLGAARGPCPWQPTASGGYHVAGLAHFARTHDLRADLPDTQRVRTFAVEMPYRPGTIEIPLANGRVRLTPAYRLRSGGNNVNEAANTPAADGGGRLLRLRVVVSHREVADASSTVPATGTGHFYAKYYLAWDDTEQGADFDQDAWSTLETRVDTTVSPATVRVTVETIAHSTVTGQLVGFVIEGTTQDGFHAYSGLQGGNYHAATGLDPSGVPGCSNCRALSEAGGQRGPQAHTFTVASAPADPPLHPPLHYAAKWGGFVDLDCDGAPGTADEWDTRDANGVEQPGGDGVPDTYFALRDAGRLREAIDAIVERIVGEPTSSAHCDLGDRDQDGIGNTEDPDDDNDGMPDDWETTYGLNPFEPADATFDQDDDGATNLQEFFQDTDPNVPDSPAELQIPLLPRPAALLLGLTLVVVASRVRRARTR